MMNIPTRMATFRKEILIRASSGYVIPLVYHCVVHHSPVLLPKYPDHGIQGTLFCEPLRNLGYAMAHLNTSDDLDVLVLDENSNITIPSEFDARQKWPYCNSIGQISDQSVCGSCWAFATTEMITDRICIHSLGSSTPEISAQDLLTCGFWNGDGCDGSSVVTALEYWVDNGISTGGGFGSKNGCKSYTFISCTNEDGNKNSTRPKCSDVDELNAPACDKRCDDIRIDYEKSLYFGNKIYRIESVVRTIQLEILNNGPVIATFMAYEDFLHYHHGIYRYLMGEELGFHSVKIIGWGEEDGTPYWVVANSYNDEWGEDGFFRIVRGTNECFIETFLYAGIPELNPVMKKVR